jgi:hypothetical protein
LYVFCPPSLHFLFLELFSKDQLALWVISACSVEREGSAVDVVLTARAI